MENLGQQITISKVNNSIYKILSNDKSLTLDIENVKLPFGVDSYTYNRKKTFYLKLEINNILKNYIIDIETQVKTILESVEKSSAFSIKSQIMEQGIYNPNMIVKIKQYRDKILTKIKDNDGALSLFDIEKNTILDMKITPNIYIDKDNNIIVKWTAKEICVK